MTEAPFSTAALVAGELKRQAVILAQPADDNGVAVRRIHAMRVATRRARSVLRNFTDARPVEHRSLDAELKWLANVLGPVRDLDVYLERYRRWLAKLPAEDAAALDRYEAYLASEHASARVALMSALSSERHQALITALRAPYEAPLLAFDAVASAKPSEVGRRYVDGVLARVLKHGQRLADHAPAPDLHELRKEIKRLRYLLEMLEPFLGGDVRRLRKLAVRLQDVLGEHEDAHVAEKRVRAYLDASPTGIRQEWFALGRLAEAERCAARRARKRYAKIWRDFEKAATPA